MGFFHFANSILDPHPVGRFHPHVGQQRFLPGVPTPINKKEIRRPKKRLDIGKSTSNKPIRKGPISNSGMRSAY